MNAALLPSPPLEQVSETPEENDCDCDCGENKADDEEVVVEGNQDQEDVEEQPPVIDKVADQMNDLALGGQNETEEDTSKSQNLNDQLDLSGTEAEVVEETDDAQEDNTGEDDAAVNVDEAVKE